MSRQQTTAAALAIAALLALMPRAFAAVEAAGKAGKEEPKRAHAGKGDASASAAPKLDLEVDAEGRYLAPDYTPYGEKDIAEEVLAKPVTGQNLLKNGGFEDGKYWPYGWDPCDKLSTMWVEDGWKSKKCLRINTQILESQWKPVNEGALEYAKEAAKKANGSPQSVPTDPIPAPPALLPTKPPYYDCVGGTYGVHYRSEFFKVVPNAVYKFTIDVRGPGGTPKVFIKGFAEREMTAEKPDGQLGKIKHMAKCGDKLMNLHNLKRDEWQRYVCLFHPAQWKSTFKEELIRPEYLQIQLYAYWPVGIYDFDNARLEIVGYDPPPPTGKSNPWAPEVKTGPDGATTPKTKPLGDEEYPVIGK